MKLGRERRLRLYLVGQYGQFWRSEDYVDIGKVAIEFRKGWDAAESDQELDNIAIQVLTKKALDRRRGGCF